MIPNNKKSFALFITIFLVILFSLFSYKIVENNIFGSNLNKLKYLHIQANIHLEYIKNYISTHNETQINSFALDDDRYVLNITKKDENGTVLYYIGLNTSDDTPVRLSDKVIK
ncbi:MAG: hypothetical protein U9N59_14230 [Campylobacterota bacterium]|nr:hypothetical protein [Campylobacterota bacterium]